MVMGCERLGGDSVCGLGQRKVQVVHSFTRVNGGLVGGENGTVSSMWMVVIGCWAQWGAAVGEQLGWKWWWLILSINFSFFLFILLFYFVFLKTIA